MAAKKGLGLGARMAAQPTDAVAAGLEAVLSQSPTSLSTGEVVALNIRLPKVMHRTLRQIAHDQETSINALIIKATTAMLESGAG